MRTLKFTEENKDAYNLIYEGFTFTERPFKGSDVRLAAKIFNKLEEIGKFSEEVRGSRVFTFAKEGLIKLEEPEYSFMRECLNNISWNAAGARKAAPILDWFEAIKEE